MTASYQQSLWKQFGATIDMLENAITMCPEKLWDTDSLFWYKAYHTLFYMDYYLSPDPDSWAPPKPFTLSEFDASGKMPDRTYSKDELLAYLRVSREKCNRVIASLNDELAAKRWINPQRDYSFFEMLIYNMRHVQHHTAQLNMLLRQGINDAPRWVSQTVGELKAYSLPS
jgi:hypothetical protein